MAQRSPKLHPVWQGVRFRRVQTAPDPDAPPRPVTLPAAWEDEAAAALAALVPGSGPVHLATAAAAWIAPACAARRRVAGEAEAEALERRLHARLRARQAAPSAALWSGGTEEEAPGFVFNLPAFFDPVEGFAAAAFAEAVDDAVFVLAALRPEADRLALGFADLAGLLAALGLSYGSAAADATARSLAALLRLAAEAASARHGAPQGRALQPAPPLPPLPDPTALPPALGPALAATLGKLAAAVGPMRAHERLTAIGPAGPVEALLGAEAGGFAPAFGLVDGEGRLRRAARAFLAARGLDAETALARALNGTPPLAEPKAAEVAAMAASLAPWIERLPPALPLPEAREESTRETKTALAGAVFAPLPARRRGYTQKVQIGGHPLFLRSGEYPDGRLGEIALSAPREAPAVRALLESVAEAISIGLQHGVPLAAYVEAFAHSRFGPHGAVEGDAQVDAATSFLDYAVRHLAAVYLGQEIPAAEADPPAPAAPLLPLDLPEGPAPRSRRRFKVVA
jgi:ribonucleoside-diphosphate reductase alpha chain